MSLVFIVWVLGWLSGRLSDQIAPVSNRRDVARAWLLSFSTSFHRTPPHPAVYLFHSVGNWGDTPQAQKHRHNFAVVIKPCVVQTWLCVFFRGAVVHHNIAPERERRETIYVCIVLAVIFNLLHRTYAHTHAHTHIIIYVDILSQANRTVAGSRQIWR